MLSAIRNHLSRNLVLASGDLRATPTAAYITRLTGTATFAYLLALLVPAGTSRPVLAPLTALLVLQASLYQTIRSGIRKVASVTVGVLSAVVVAQFIGFSWWQLGLVIAGALLIGRALRLGDDLLEVPISAMLIFSATGTHAAATGRLVDTLVGTFAGLASGLVLARPRVQPARQAVGELAGRLAGLLDKMADGLAGPADELTASSAQWLTAARALRDEIERVDDTLREAADSVRLNPRARLGDAVGELPATGAALGAGLETLEHATLTVRGLARSVLQSAGIDSERSPVRDTATRQRLASVLTTLGTAIRTYASLVQTMPSGSEELESALAAQLAQAHQLQDQLADLLEPRAVLAPGAADAATEWPLRGEILSHVDRLRSGLRPDAIPRQRRAAAARVRRREPGSRPTGRGRPWRPRSSGQRR